MTHNFHPEMRPFAISSISRRVFLVALCAMATLALVAAPANAKANKIAKSSDGKYAQCAQICKTCEAACKACADHCKAMVKSGMKQYRTTEHLCQDTADICHAAAKVCDRKGPMSADICAACAKACDACGATCGKNPSMAPMAACAKACATCSAACKQIAGS